MSCYSYYGYGVIESAYHRQEILHNFHVLPFAAFVYVSCFRQRAVFCESAYSRLLRILQRIEEKSYSLCIKL